MTAKQQALLRYLRIAPRKVRAVAHMIRGLTVVEAEAQLLHEPRRPAQPLLKLLRSAVANAKSGKKLAIEKLYVENIRVDGGPMLKRHLPRARGMATPLQKKMSHVILVLAEKPDAAPARFTIVTQKKAKLPAEEKPKTKRTPAKAPETLREKQKPGFWRRIFHRKTI